MKPLHIAIIAGIGLYVYKRWGYEHGSVTTHTEPPVLSLKSRKRLNNLDAKYKHGVNRHARHSLTSELQHPLRHSNDAPPRPTKFNKLAGTYSKIYHMDLFKDVGQNIIK